MLASASEAKTGNIYLGARHGFPLCIACIKLGHPHSENGTPFETDNSTTYGILASNMHGKLSKALDMRYQCIKDRTKQKMFDLIWAAGKQNAADYLQRNIPNGITKE